MKRNIAILIIALASSIVWSCGDDHATQHSEDTTSPPQSMDTSRTTTNTGGASILDDSGSGGTKDSKDSLRTKKDSSKK